jgi:hypothetical protein
MWSSVVSDPLDEFAADPDVISSGGEDFSAFVASRWPGLFRLAFGLTGDRWGRGIRLRRAATVAGGLGVAAIIAAAVVAPPAPVPPQPPLPVTVLAGGIAGPGGVFASGTADGRPWRLAVQDIADPGYRCIPAITINGTDADPVYPSPGNGASVAPRFAAPGIGFAFVQVPADVDRLVIDGRESVPAIAATACGLTYRVVGFAYRLAQPPRITAVSARPGWPRTHRSTGSVASDWPAVYQIQPPSASQTAGIWNNEGRTSAETAHGLTGRARLTGLAGRALADVARGGVARGALEPAPVGLPPRLVAGRHVVVARAQADRAVDELADDVGLPGVPVGLGDHVDQDLVQRHLAAVLRPPRDMTDVVQRERADGGVGMRPGPPVQAGDLLTGLVGGGPHVRVGLGVVLQPGQRLAERAPEGIAEVPELHAGHVLDQS